MAYNNNNGNYYDKQSIITIERAQLAEDIPLPTITTEKINLEFFESGKTCILAQNVYIDTMGKFYLNVMTPLLNKQESKMETKSAPSTRGHKGSSLNTRSYTSTNYVNLVVPKYILLNFTGRVPKGTEFIVASIGGSLDVEDMRIIGIYSLDTSSSNTEGASIS